MSDLTPLEQAKAFLEMTSPALDDAWLAKVHDRGDSCSLTYGVLRALVAQIDLDAKRLKDYAAYCAEMQEDET